AFDAVLCQMSLMFFPDRAAALREMRRVARPGGTVALVVPGSLRDQPAYAPFVEMVARHVGDGARSLLGAYFACGDLAELTALVEAAGLKVRETRTRQGRVRLDSADDFVAVEVKSTPLAARMSE